MRRDKECRVLLMGIILLTHLAAAKGPERSGETAPLLISLPAYVHGPFSLCEMPPIVVERLDKQAVIAGASPHVDFGIQIARSRGQDYSARLPLVCLANRRRTSPDLGLAWLHILSNLQGTGTVSFTLYDVNNERRLSNTLSIPASAQEVPVIVDTNVFMHFPDFHTYLGSDVERRCFERVGLGRLWEETPKNRGVYYAATAEGWTPVSLPDARAGELVLVPESPALKELNPLALTQYCEDPAYNAAAQPFVSYGRIRVDFDEERRLASVRLLACLPDEFSRHHGTAPCDKDSIARREAEMNEFVENGTMLKAFLAASGSFHPDPGTTFDITPDGTRLFAWPTRGLNANQSYALPGGEETDALWPLRKDRFVIAPRLSPNGEFLAYFTRRDDSCGAEIARLDTGAMEHKFASCDRLDEELALHWSPDGMRVVTIMGDTLTLWSTVSGEREFDISLHARDPYASVKTPIAFSADGKWLAFGDRRNPAVKDPKAGCRIGLWSIEEGKHAREWTLDSYTIACVALSDDGQRLAAGGSNGRVKVWVTSSGDELLSLQRPAELAIEGLLFDRQGQDILFLDAGGTLAWTGLAAPSETKELSLKTSTRGGLLTTDPNRRFAIIRLDNLGVWIGPLSKLMELMDTQPVRRL
ncbi:MAG: hypothetical protein KA248_06920 [Kiritimatiellae bacterium]|nr:hypothetical protein [Kiritimatiellia bacterium]